VLRVKLVACTQLGRIDEARHCLRQVLEVQPELTIARLKDYPFPPEIQSLYADGFGMRVGRKRVARLMSQTGLAGVSRRKFVVTTLKSDSRQAPDLVERDFHRVSA
jgi:helix-turn-helix protein